jgi:hypothetical protein
MYRRCSYGTRKLLKTAFIRRFQCTQNKSKFFTQKLIRKCFLYKHSAKEGLIDLRVLFSYIASLWCVFDSKNWSTHRFYEKILSYKRIFLLWSLFSKWLLKPETDLDLAYRQCKPGLLKLGFMEHWCSLEEVQMIRGFI